MSTFLTLLMGVSLMNSCTDNKLNIDYPDYVKEETAGSYPGYSLVWSEEFEYEGLPSENNFDYEEGYSRNNEKQDYKKSDLKYSRVEDGKLVIEAHKDPHTEKNPYTNENYEFEYSSASVITKNKIDFKYGRIDISAKIPTGKGLWPALWLLPVEDVYGGWPNSGEIDIMEYVWGDKKHNSIYSTVHNAYSKSKPGSVVSGTFDSETLSSTFHLYSLVWKKEKIDILFDNNVVFSYDRTEDSYAKWPFDQKFYLIMNIAVGGSWGGQWGIDEGAFPAKMEIDYIRYYKAEDDTDDVEEPEPEPELPGEIELIKNGDLIAKKNGIEYPYWDTGGWTFNPEGQSQLQIEIEGKKVNTLRFAGPGYDKEIFQEVDVAPGMKINWSFYGRISDTALPSGEATHTSTGKILGRVFYGDEYENEITDGRIEITNSFDTKGITEFTVPNGVYKVKVLIGKYFEVQPDPKGGLIWIAKVSFKTTPDFIDAESLGTSPNAKTGKDWDLVFSDEFSGNSLSTLKWKTTESTISRGPRPRLGIDEWYFKGECVSVSDGKLILKATKPEDKTLYCGAVETGTKYSRFYGFYEVNMKISDVQCGTHSAFWLMPFNGFGNEIGTGKDGAEIDIFESPFLEEKAASTIHIDGYAENHQGHGVEYSTKGIHEGYHTFGMWWTKDFMRFYYDGNFVAEISDRKWISKVNSYILLSVGANFYLRGDYFTSKNIGDLTQAEVDYIRVWKERKE